MEDLKTRVLEKIETDHVRMHSGKYFILKAIALGLIALAVLLLTIFICNFMLFSIRIGEQGSLLSFGPHGIWVFIKLFPWPLLLFDVGLMCIFVGLFKKFSFAYRIPLFYLLMAVLVLALGISVLLDRGIQVNETLLEHAHRRRLPPGVNGFYEHAHFPAPERGVCICRIVGFEDEYLLVEDTHDAIRRPLKVDLPDDYDVDSLQIGGVLFIAGNLEQDVIRAYGIRPSH